MAYGLKRLRLAVVGALAVALVLASAASASDTFTLVNNSTWGLGGTWFGYQPPCTGGPFSNDPYTITTGESASITLSRTAFTACDGSLSISGYDVANGATWYFNPDDPTIGGASIASCYGDPSLASIVEFSINGLTCTASNPPQSAPDANIVASTASLRGNDAFVPVQLFARRATGMAHIEVAIRDTRGRLHGRAREMMAVGWPRDVEVPIDRSLRLQVAKHKQVDVWVTVRRIDGKPGRGDHKKIILQADRPDLQF